MFFKNNFNKIIGIMLGLFIIISGFCLAKIGYLDNKSDAINFYGFSIGSFSVLMAMLQFRSNNIWSKKDRALAVTKEVQKEIESDFKLIDEHFHYYQKKLTDSNIAIKLSDIHDKICMKDDKGNLIASDTTSSLKYKLDPTVGAKIRGSILNILNMFEYMAVGINQGIFDKSVITNLYEGIFLKFHRVFKEYIDHYKNDMNPARKNEIWVNYLQLANECEISLNRKNNARG